MLLPLGSQICIYMPRYHSNPVTTAIVTVTAARELSVGSLSAIDSCARVCRLMTRPFGEANLRRSVQNAPA